MTTGRRRRGDLIGVALRLGRLLESEDYVLVVGLAVGVHGFVRASNGLEFMSRGPFSRARKLLREAGGETRVSRSEVREDEFTRVRGEQLRLRHHQHLLVALLLLLRVLGRDLLQDGRTWRPLRSLLSVLDGLLQVLRVHRCRV